MTETSTVVLRELSSLWDDLLSKSSDKLQEINDLLKEKQLDGLREKNIKLALGLFLAKANLSNEPYKIRFLSAVRDLLCVFEKNGIVLKYFSSSILETSSNLNASYSLGLDLSNSSSCEILILGGGFSIIFECENAIEGGTFDFKSDSSFMVDEINLHYNKFITQFEF